MEQHVRVLGLANIAYGLGGGLLSLLLLMFGGIGAIHVWADAYFGIGPAGVVFVIFHLIVALPMALVGLGLLRYNENARLAGIVIGAANLLNLPAGSVLGIYGLWVLLSPETEPLFLDPVLKRVHNRRSAPSAPKPALKEAPARRRHLYAALIKLARLDLPK